MKNPLLFTFTWSLSRDVGTRNSYVVTAASQDDAWAKIAASMNASFSDVGKLLSGLHRTVEEIQQSPFLDPKTAEEIFAHHFTNKTK